MAYNPYTAANAIYKLKGQWDSANKAGDKTKKNEAAQNAQKYYEELRRNGYGYVADELNASDHTRAKKIVDSWAAVTDPVTGSYKTGVNNPAYNSEMKLASDNTQNLVKQQASDRSMMTDKYGKLENYIYEHNPYESEIGKSIMDGYTWKGAKASDNEIASGAASNGGNVDSFAAANAARQQLAFTNAGKLAVLNDYNARIGNIQKTLGDLGVYLQNQDAGMQKSINMQDSRAHSLFDNEQTSKINDTSIKAEIAGVTGVAPDEWVASNNPYMNDDGTIKAEFKDADFSDIMKKARASGNMDAYNAAAVARFYKIMGDYGKYGQYDDGNYKLPGAQVTEERRQFDEKIAQADRALEAEKSEGAAERQNKLDQIATSAKYGTTTTGKTPTKTTGMTLAQATTALKGGELSQAALDVYNANHGTSYTKENPPPIYKPPATTKGDTPVWVDGDEAEKKSTPYTQTDAWSELVTFLTYSWNDAEKKRMLVESKEKGIINESQYDYLYRQYLQ